MIKNFLITFIVFLGSIGLVACNPAGPADGGESTVVRLLPKSAPQFEQYYDNKIILKDDIGRDEQIIFIEDPGNKLWLIDLDRMLIVELCYDYTDESGIRWYGSCITA